MPKFTAKITPFLCAAAILLGFKSAAADVPTTLLSGAMANFTLAAPQTPAPEISFAGPDGQEMSLDAFRGKLVVLNFWATWCAPCRREMPDLDKLQARFGGPGFEVVALSLDRKGAAVIPPFYAEVGVGHLKIYSDRTMKSMRAFAAPGLPTTVIVGPDGSEKGRLIGPADWASPEAIALIEHFLAEAGDARAPLKSKAGG